MNQEKIEEKVEQALDYANSTQELENAPLKMKEKEEIKASILSGESHKEFVKRISREYFQENKGANDVKIKQ
jgi:hypothetical protein